jgi:hypothetical protein
MDAGALDTNSSKENWEMSAAATAAGYLYASGRLRGRGAREQEQGQEQQQPQPPEKKPARKEEIRVAVLSPREELRGAEPAPKKAPKIEYRTRKRWTAE